MSCGCTSACVCYIVEAVANPVISPESQSFYSNLTITITCSTQNAAIHYTLDGSTPTVDSPIYSGSFNVSSTTKVKAIALLQYFAPSNVVSKSYTKQTQQGTLYWGYSSISIIGTDEIPMLNSAYEPDPYRTYSFDADSVVGDYFYYWWPDWMGAPRSVDGFKNLNTGLAMEMAGPAQGFDSGNQNGWYYHHVLVNGTWGKLWRSLNPMGGAGVINTEVLPAVMMAYRADTTLITADSTTFTADYAY